MIAVRIRVWFALNYVSPGLQPGETYRPDVGVYVGFIGVSV